MLGNFPNPFNNTTHIRYQIPENSKVAITIYNILGERVKTLVSERQEAGGYVVRWDGRNDFYQTSDQNKEAVKKILLLK